MRAVRLVGPEHIEVEEVPEPHIIAPTDAIVRVSESAICGADLLPYHGYVPGFEFGTILGHEFVGEVVEVGNSVAQIEVGARVVNTSMTSDGTCVHCRANRATQCLNRSLFGYSGVYPRLDGGQADFVRVPMADRCLWNVPDAVSSDDAIFVADILPTGYVGVQHGRVSFGDLVVVLGCGPVGLMAIMSALGTARRVIAVDSVADRKALATELGALAVDPAEAPAVVDRLSGSLGADVVVEASGSIPALQSALEMVRPQGVVSVIGAHFEPDFPLNNGLMFDKEITVVFSVGNPGRDREMLLRAIESGSLSPSRVLTHKIPLDEAADAYRAFAARQMTKVALTTA